MASLMKWLVNDYDQFPMYCYAEGSLRTNNNHIQKIENANDISLTSLDSNSEDNREVNSEYITSNKPSSPHKVSSTNAHNICPSIDMNEETNPFRKSQSINFHAPTEPMKRMHVNLWQENVQLLTTHNKFFPDLLKRSSITNKVFKNHLAFERHFNNLLKSFQEALVMEDDEFFASAGFATDAVNDTILSEVSNSKDEIPIPKLPLSCMPFADQNITMLTNSFSHLCNTNDDNHGMYNTEFPTFNMNDPKIRSVQEVRPMHRVNDKRTGYIQHDSNRINGNMSLMELTQNSSVFDTDHNLSNVFSSTNNKFNVFSQCDTENPFLNETNPFKVAMTSGVQMLEMNNDGNNCGNTITTKIQKQKPFMDKKNVCSTNTMTMNNETGPVGYECDISAINAMLSQVIRENDAIIYDNQKKRMELKQFDMSYLPQESLPHDKNRIGEYALNSRCIPDQRKNSDKEISFLDLWEPFVIRTHIEHALKKVPNDFRNTVSDCSIPVKNSFLFQKISVVKGITFIFYMDNTGWILAHEFLKVFVNLILCPRLLIILESMTTGIKEIQRSEYPNHFLFFDNFFQSFPSNMRDINNKIISFNLISFEAMSNLLCKFKMLSYKEIENAIMKNEYGSSPVIKDLMALVTAYNKLI